MAKLEGIIFKAFGNYIVIRGFAKIGEIAKVSERPAAYQRIADEKHKRDIIDFLSEGKYAYFPELILAYRANKFSELVNILRAEDNDIDWDAEEFIPGLKVLRERVPASGYRARHANLNINPNQKKLTRIDGNHRLESFDENNDWWWDFIKEDYPENYTEEDIIQWKNHKIKLFKEPIENKLVPFAIVISDATMADDFEAGIFNNVNFKQLPLKLETNLKNLSLFEDLRKTASEFGDEYPLAMELINLAEQSHFVGLPFLEPLNDDEKDKYRTACFRISQVLLERRSDVKEKIEKLNLNLEKLDQEIQSKKESLNNIPETNFEKKSLPNKINNQDLLDDQSAIKEQLKSEIKDIDYSIEILQKEIQRGEKYLLSTELVKKNELGDSINIIKIEQAIQSLRPIYLELENNHGNIEMLSALVYYRLRDNNKFDAFFEWIKKNGINSVIRTDELSMLHNCESLIGMFEQIYEARKRKVFISMQFGDDASEMIYEKITQAIEYYNKRKDGVNIKISPIRIDRTIAPHAFTISEEILEAISNSGLIIADLSSANKNVYHEIGYAMGIAKEKGIRPPIILLYKENTTLRPPESNVDNYIGFNLRGFSQLRFKTYDELTKGLLDRLEKYFEI